MVTVTNNLDRPFYQYTIMTKQIKYKCDCCGEEHDDWPALTFNSPDNYHKLSQNDKESIAEIGSDYCIITHPGQTDRFIRCTLTQKVTNHCENLEYGLWVSLSEKSYRDYVENYHNENHETQYFGWLCNELPEYEFKESIPATVFTRTGNQRPEIIPYQDFDHPFVNDYYNGITKDEAERRIKSMLQKPESTGTSKEDKKPWWKIW